jgi:adenylosuccinate lyase
VLPDGALAADAILLLAADVARGLEVREAAIRRNIGRVMPFMATERWLVLGGKAGGDRQTLHEVMRRHSWAVADAVDRGEPNDLLERLAADPAFARVDAAALRAELDPARYVGRAPSQVTEYLRDHVEPLLRRLEPYATTDDPGVRV